MGDAGEGEQSLEILLHQGHEVAVEHRGDRQAGEQGTEDGVLGCGQHDEPYQHRHRSELGQGGDETGRFIRATLVNVGRPKMEGEHCQLVIEPHPEHRQTQGGHRGLDDVRQPGHQERQVSGSGQPEQIAHPEEHDAVGGHAEHHVLDGRLHLAALFGSFPAQRHHEIQRERRKFEDDHQGDEFDATDQQHQPGDVDVHQEVILGLRVGPDIGQIAAEP